MFISLLDQRFRRLPSLAIAHFFLSASLSFPSPVPSIESITPSTPIRTSGGVVLTLTGKYFLQPGCAVGTVTINGVSCPVVANSWSSSQIQCTVPAGTGTTLPIVVRTAACTSSTGQTIGGLSSATFPLSYGAPTISGFSPPTCPSSGLVLSVSNLGYLMF